MNVKQEAKYKNYLLQLKKKLRVKLTFQKTCGKIPKPILLAVTEVQIN